MNYLKVFGAEPHVTRRLSEESGVMEEWTIDVTFSKPNSDVKEKDVFVFETQQEALEVAREWADIPGLLQKQIVFNQQKLEILQLTLEEVVKEQEELKASLYSDSPFVKIMIGEEELDEEDNEEKSNVVPLDKYLN